LWVKYTELDHQRLIGLHAHSCAKSRIARTHRILSTFL
jgi:hypothetical protein